ncbi:hypothetical protein E2562_011351 [Oryza meyeriana var. granulata]|uniref:OTU domain-containing protein n=1 Tax=Oryza meyeriana var. granulata TaxID=110450 RepID=A0A6G1BUF9_9ORYZ|nr:hypothetical protein E2562_011351 [Oryza meyeriana var. granulata]
MASASGPPKDQEEPVHGRGQREPHESTSSSSAAAPSADTSVAAASQGGADASPPPPPPPPAAPVESLTQEQGSEQLGDGGGRGTDGSSSDAAAVDRRGKKIAESSSSASPDAPRLLAFSRSSLRYAFIRDAEPDQVRGLPWDDPRLRKEEEKDQVTPIATRKKSLRSSILGYISNVFLCRKGSPTGFSDLNNEKEPPPLVHHQKIPLADVPDHYCLPPGLRGIVSSNFLILFSKYSEFRPVHGDGECFYRSFIISYLEQVLDREDTDEEQRLLAAVEVDIKPVAMQIDYPDWAYGFSWSHKAFKKLIENLIGWKSRRNGVASTDSRKQELLKFFSSKSMSKCIFVFLRSVAATWMCSHRDEYEPHIPALGDGYTLELWCATHLLLLGEYADHIPMRALAAALGVPLRVENLHNGPAHDIYTADGVNVPRVTLLYTGVHYDILYPRPSSGGS